MQHVREEVLHRRLHRHAEEHVARAHERNFPPAAFPTALLLTQRERDLAMLLDADGDAWDGAVEEQEAQRGQQVEDEPRAERAPELDFRRRVREDESRPGEVEEEDVEGGRPGGVGREEEDGEGGDGGRDGGDDLDGAAGDGVGRLDQLPCALEERWRRALEEFHYCADVSGWGARLAKVRLRAMTASSRKDAALKSPING